jgi:hypothetical protein
MPASPIDEYQVRLDSKQSESRVRRITVDRRDDSLKRRLLEDRRKTVVPVTNDRRQGPRRTGERRHDETDRRENTPYSSRTDRRQGERRVTDRREYVTTNYSNEKFQQSIEEKENNDFDVSTMMFILSFIIIFSSILYIFFMDGSL